MYLAVLVWFLLDACEIPFFVLSTNRCLQIVMAEEGKRGVEEKNICAGVC